MNDRKKVKSMKRVLSAAAAAALAFTAAACSAQSGSDYPVSVASYTIISKPASVVCLSDSVADIIISCGYTDAVKGRTDECTQKELEGASSIGSKADPSVKKIEELSPDVVFADKSVNQEVLKKLTDDGVCVLNMITAQNGTQLDTLYSSIGAVMAGNKDGRENGKNKAQSLLTTMSDLQRVVPETDVAPVACYLYDEKCTPAPTTTFCGKLFEYAGAVNAFSLLQDETQSAGNYETSYYAECLKLGDVSCIFCDTGVKDKLMENPDLADLTAIKNGNVYVGNHTEWGKGRFGRFQGMSQNIHYTFNNQTFRKLLGMKDKVSKRFASSSADDDDEDGYEDEDVDPMMQNVDPDRKKGREAESENASTEIDEDGYLKFQMPWSLTVSYGVSMRENTAAPINPKRMRYPYKFTHTLNFSGNVGIAKGWNINFSSGYDFNYKRLSMTTLSLARDLHCFSMSCSMVVYPYTSFNFLFACKAGTLTDALRWKKQSSYSSNVEWY